MGSSQSAIEVVGKLARLEDNLRDIPKEQVGAAALHVKRSVLAVAPARLRGVGKKGAKLGVDYKTATTLAEGDAYAVVKAMGPWQLIERDTQAHRIPKERTRGRVRHAVIPGGSEEYPHGKRGVRNSVQSPGTKGQHPWARGVEAAKPGVATKFRASLPEALRKVF